MCVTGERRGKTCSFDDVADSLVGDRRQSSSVPMRTGSGPLILAWELHPQLAPLLAGWLVVLLLLLLLLLSSHGNGPQVLCRNVPNLAIILLIAGELSLFSGPCLRRRRSFDYNWDCLTKGKKGGTFELHGISDKPRPHTAIPLRWAATLLLISGWFLRRTVIMGALAKIVKGSFLSQGKSCPRQVK